MRLRMFFAWLQANRATIISIIAFLLAIFSIAYLVVEARQERAVVPPRSVVLCFASENMRAGQVFYRDSAPISCRSYSVLLTEEIALSFSPTQRENLPEIFVALVDIPAGAIISAHDFTRLFPVNLPVLLTNGELELDAHGRYAIYFPIPEEAPVELLRGYVGAHSLVVEGYCYVMEGEKCLFLVEKFSLRGADDKPLIIVEGDSYNFINLLSYVSGWTVWRYDYPLYPPALSSEASQ